MSRRPRSTPPPALSWWQRIVSAVVRLPRIARIVLVSVIALATTLLVMPAIDTLYLTYFFSPATVILPSLVAAGIGLLIYALGWWVIVGLRGTLPEQMGAAALYLVGGVLVLSAVLVLVVVGAADLMAG